MYSKLMSTCKFKLIHLKIFKRHFNVVPNQLRYQTKLINQFLHISVKSEARVRTHRHFMGAENISFQLKRYLSTHSCVFLIHKYSSCFSRSAAICACVPISLSAERQLDPAFHWKQLLMRTLRSKLYILLRMRSFFHHW